MTWVGAPFLFFLLLLSTTACASTLLTRNLECDKESAPRAKAICHSLEHEMRWVWFGHAIVSPGFRVTFDSVRNTYCRLPVRDEDTAVLVNMVLQQHLGAGGMRGVQIDNGARWLLFLLGDSALDHFPAPALFPKPEDARGVENLRQEIIRNIGDSGMIWNRSNPHYLLRDGCR